MPPKLKQSKNKGKSNAKQKNSDSKAVSEARRAQTEIAYLQQQIQIQKRDVLEARQAERMWRNKCEEIHAQCEKERENLLDIIQDRARRSTVLQDKKQQILDDLEAQLRIAERENKNLQAQLQQSEQDAADRVSELQSQVSNLQKQMESMHLEYSQMLKTTLQKFDEELLQPYTVGLLDQNSGMSANEYFESIHSNHHNSK